MVAGVLNWAIRLVFAAVLPAQDETSVGVIEDAAEGKADEGVRRPSAGPPLNLPPRGVNAIDHGWAAPLQGTSKGIGACLSDRGPLGQAPKKMVPVDPLNFSPGRGLPIDRTLLNFATEGEGLRDEREAQSQPARPPPTSRNFLSAFAS